MSIHHISQLDFDTLPQGQPFVVDTNVLYFVHSGYYIPDSPVRDKQRIYSEFLAVLLKRGIPVYVSAANMQELLHVIENTQYLLYCEQNHLDRKQWNKKRFRSLEEERAKLQETLATICCELQNTYHCVNLTITFAAIKQYACSLASHSYDPIDYIWMEENVHSHFLNVITDDGDFRHDRRIRVYTL